MITDYELLKLAGHSPAKAAEIVIDATRGNEHALRWIKTMRVLMPRQPQKCGGLI